MYQSFPGQTVTLTANISAADEIMPGGEALAALLGANYTTLLLNKGAAYEVVKAENFGASLKITRGQYGSTAQPWLAGSCARWIPEPADACIEPSFSFPIPPAATVGDFVFVTSVIAGSGPFTLQNSLVPQGMSAEIVGNVLIVSGIPTVAGQQTIVASVNGCCGSFTAQSNITVNQ